MGSTLDERFAFVVEWYDQLAALVRKYELLFYPSDNSVEMFDLKNKRIFLRRTKTDSISLKDLFVGNVINLFARQLSIVDYSDDFSRTKLGNEIQKTIGVVTPDAVDKIGEIIDLVTQHGFQLSKMRMMCLNKNDVFDMYKNDDQSQSYFADVLSYLTGGPIVAFEVVGEGAVSKFADLCGPEDPVLARSDAPLTIRARFGTSVQQNAIRFSKDQAAAMKESQMFFPTTAPPRTNTAKFVPNECTLCLIKPHAIIAGALGKIISAISECNFEVSALSMHHLETVNAEEFLEVYKGVLKEYPEMVVELTSGPCVALEVRALDGPVVFREFCGPYDPEVARHLRPNTLRARFGRNKIRNAVHCTDLVEDAPLELEYFFKILDKQSSFTY